MADQEMVEKVAKAIWQSDATLLYMPEEYRKMARAVIAVQREPTEHMLSEGCAALHEHWSELYGAQTKLVWQAMNDAILGEDDDA